MLRKIVDAFKVYFVLVVLLFTSVYLVYDSISGCLKYSLNKDAYTICNAQIIYRNDTMDWIKFEYDYHGERRKGEMSEGLLERKVNVIQVAVDESGGYVYPKIILDRGLFGGTVIGVVVLWVLIAALRYNISNVLQKKKENVIYKDNKTVNLQSGNYNRETEKNNNVKSKLVFHIFFIIVFCLYLLNLCTLIYADMKEYITYKNNQERYHISTVEIHDIKEYASDDWSSAIFYYKDYGIQKEGKTKLGYNEKIGDYIEMAFDENMNYVRTNIVLSKEDIWDYVICIFAGVLMVYAMFIYQKKSR